MNLVYEKSNLSGIGDRLLDLILVYTYAKMNKYENIFLNWRIDKNLGTKNGKWNTLRTEKTSFRKIDYLEENLLKHLEFPNDINFVSEKKLNELKTNNKIFSEYLGGTSVFDFMNKFKIENKTEFEKEYYNNFHKIKFKNIPENIKNKFNEKIITIHLRRGDKVDNQTNINHGVNENELKELDLLTKQFINQQIEQGFNNFCFISDEKRIKDEYVNLYQNKCNIISVEGDEKSQTYFDLYAMAHSEKILMSQKLSCFTILGTLLGNGKLCYLYNEGRFKQLGFDRYKLIKSPV